MLNAKMSFAIIKTVFLTDNVRQNSSVISGNKTKKIHWSDCLLL